MHSPPQAMLYSGFSILCRKYPPKNMSFSIRHVKQQELELITITDETTGTEIALLPGFGATLQAFRIRQKDGSLFNVINSYKDGSELKREGSRSFKGPKLSPFPCRIPDGI